MKKKDLLNAGLEFGSNAAMDVSNFTTALLKSELTEKAVSSFASATANVYGSVLQTIQYTLVSNNQMTEETIERIKEIIEYADEESYERRLQEIRMIIEAQKHTQKVNLIIVFSLIAFVLLTIVILWNIMKGIFGWIMFFLLIWLIIKSVMLGKKFFMK